MKKLILILFSTINCDINYGDLNQEDQLYESLNKCLGLRDEDQDNSCLIGLCSKNCLKYSDYAHEIEEVIEKRCFWGCKLQTNTFAQTKAKYPTTPAENILGQALDKCWEGCNGMHLSSISEVSSCNRGCTEMRSFQKKITSINSNQEDSQIKQEDEFFQKKDAEIIDISAEGHKKEEINPGTNSYVMWKYYNMDQMINKQKEFYKYINIILNQLLSDNDINDDDDEVYYYYLSNSGRGGYKDDTQQLQIPYQQTAPMQSELKQSEDFFNFDEAKQRLGAMTERVRQTLNTPEWREMSYYFLFGLSGFMLVTIMMDLLQAKKRSGHQDEDVEEYTFVKSKLPTYEECMMAAECKNHLQVDIHYPTKPVNNNI